MSKGPLHVSAADLPGPGEMVSIPRPGIPVALYNINGSFYATLDRCTHGAALLTDGDLDGDEVECPLHGGAFHVPTGEARCFPVTKAVRTFEIEMDGNGGLNILNAAKEKIE